MDSLKIYTTKIFENSRHIGIGLLMLLSLSLNLSAQIFIESTSSEQSTGTTLTFTHNRGTIPNTLTLVSIQLGRQTTITGSVTYGGGNMTLVGSTVLTVGTARSSVYIYSILNAPTGNQDVFINVSGSNGIVAGAVSFSGVDISNPLNTYEGNTGNSNTASVSGIPTSELAIVFSAVSHAHNSVPSFGTDQIQQWQIITNTSGDRAKGAGSTKLITTGNTTSVSYTFGGSARWAAGAVSINPYFCGGNITNLDLPAIADSDFWTSEPDENYGNCDLTYVQSGGSTDRALYQFDLSSVPSSAVIISANIRLTKVSGDDNPHNLSMHRITSSWTEGTGACDPGHGNTNDVSWNNSTTGTPWGTVGGDFDSTPESAVSVATNNPYDWNVKDLVEEWLAGNFDNYGVLLKFANEAESGSKVFASRENSTTANRPQLLISYTVPNYTADVIATDVECNGGNDGTIQITSPVGGSGTYEYRINSGTWQTSGSFVNLVAGSYQVEMRDANYTQCVVDLGDQIIDEPDVLDATVVKTDPTCNGGNDGSITITSPSGGSGTYEYRLDAGSWQSSGSFSGLSSATYSVQIRDAALPSCIVTLGDQILSNQQYREIYFRELDGVKYVIEPFRIPGSYSFVPPAGIDEVEYLVVAGGGSGGSAPVWGGGGGGAGGVIEGITSVSGPLAVTVGAGGVAANNVDGNPGENSQLASLATAIGGGGGAGTIQAGNGGSGGGGSDSNPPVILAEASVEPNVWTSSITVDKPSGTQEDDLLVAFISGRLGGSYTPTVNMPGGWTLINTTLTGSEASDVLGHWCYKIANASEPSSYTWTFNNNVRHLGRILRIVDYDPLNPIGSFQVNDGVSGTLTSPSVNVNQPGSLLLFLGAMSNGNTIATPTGMNSLAGLFSENETATIQAFQRGAWELVFGSTTGTRTATQNGAIWIAASLIINKSSVIIPGGTGTASQGFAGGDGSAGGAGGGGASEAGTSNPGGGLAPGGDGVESDVIGIPTFYGGGGGGSYVIQGSAAGGQGGGGASGASDGDPGQDALSNSGGGGGGALNASSGAGGSGLVVIRYPYNDVLSVQQDGKYYLECEWAIVKVETDVEVSITNINSTTITDTLLLANGGRIRFESSVTNPEDLFVSSSTIVSMSDSSALVFSDGVSIDFSEILSNTLDFTMLDSSRLVLEEGSVYRNLSSENPLLEVQRLLTGNKGWRNISSPVRTSYFNLFDNLVTQGFPASNFPNAQSNLLYWDESYVGTSLQSWRQPANLSDSIELGRGHFHFVFDGAGILDTLTGNPTGDDYDDVLPITISVTGREAFVASQDFIWNSSSDAPLTYTARDDDPQSQIPSVNDTIYTDINVADQGWNLIANPTASTLDWDLMEIVSGSVDQSIYLWDPAANSGNGEYLTWNGSTGTLPDGRIAPFQAFWIRANQASPELGFDNTAKVFSNTAFFGKNDTWNEFSNVKISLSGLDMNTTAFISFSGYGKKGVDRKDAYRLEPMNNTWLALFTNSSINHTMPLVINHLPKDFGNELHIPLYVAASINGQLHGGEMNLSWEIPADLNNYYWILMDHQLKKAVWMNQSKTYNFINIANQKSTASAINPLDLILNPLFNKMTGESHFKSAVNNRFSIVLSTDEDDEITYRPSEASFFTPSPNPLSTFTNLKFRLPEDDYVRIDLYNAQGILLDRIVDQYFPAGLHEFSYYPNHFGSQLALFHFVSGRTQQTQKIIIVQ